MSDALFVAMNKLGVLETKVGQKVINTNDIYVRKHYLLQYSYLILELGVL